MKKWIIKVTTNWCGMDQEYAAIAEDESSLEPLAAELAYDNFNNYPGSGIEAVLDELYPDTDEDDYTDEMRDAAAECEGDYYSYHIQEWDESFGEWDTYELVYDENDKSDGKLQKYRIFAGLGGGCGGAVEIEVSEFRSKEEAKEYAYIQACDDYESHAGTNGITGWIEAMEEAEAYCERDDDMSDSEYESALEQYAQEVFNESRESWIDYWVELIEEE